jgi:hypothetical protein
MLFEHDPRLSCVLEFSLLRPAGALLLYASFGYWPKVNSYQLAPLIAKLAKLLKRPH